MKAGQKAFDDVARETCASATTPGRETGVYARLVARDLHPALGTATVLERTTRRCASGGGDGGSDSAP